jgi:hypothetical protein
VVILSRPDLAKAERTAQRDHEHHVKDADLIGAYIAEEDHLPPDRPSRVITGWSGKSRANMIKTLASLDYAPMVALGRPPAMDTLTYPADWVTVAPDGKSVKKHLATFRKRYERAWGEPLTGLWKMEFQERAAVHFHLYMVPPWGLAGDARRARHEADLIAWEVAGRPGRRPRFRAALGDGLPFRQWQSLVWADIVNHPDPEEYRKHLAAGTNLKFGEGLRCSDPRRLAVYFSKHGQYRAKDYQHDVPEEWQEPGKAPGRFWGYWGLEKAVASAELSVEDYIVAVRTARRYARSKGLLREPRVPRSARGEINPAFVRHDPQETSEGRVCMGAAGLQLTEGKVRRRKVTRRARYLSQGAGFLCVNDGPGLALQLARVITGKRRRHEQEEHQGGQGPPPSGEGCSRTAGESGGGAVFGVAAR